MGDSLSRDGRTEGSRGDEWINAWGVVIGVYEYEDEDGHAVTCPLVEVICWNNEQEG